MFEQFLKYKAEWYGKNIVQIGQFEPSSKTCSSCGFINHSLALADREWTCQCGIEHDRDVNAARNIKRFALRNYIKDSSTECTGVDVESLTLVGTMKRQKTIKGLNSNMGRIFSKTYLK